jgi:ribonuclease-3
MSSSLGESLGHAFRRPELLRQALTHRSFGADHNERLEFIGDAVLDCVIALILFRRFPAMPEGELSRLRSNLVNKETLHRLALSLGLGSSLRLGEGELRSGGAARASILADALEALFGAILVDAGFDAAQAAIQRVYAAELDDVERTGLPKDAKTRLQEWLQGRRLPVPEYSIAAVAGEAHRQSFEVLCRIPALGIAATGTGPNRRAAEQAAAASAYDQVADR